jgi:pyrroloquinoline quinone (PQQ) biosynthesis protein C
MDATTTRLLLEDALKRIKNHPFLRDAMNGNVKMEQVKRWIFCAGRESRSFPAVIEGILTWCKNPTLIEVLTENLHDERGGGAPNEAHFKHYLRLLDELHLPRSEFLSYRECAGIRVALDTAFHVAGCLNEGEALGYLLINEAMTPVIYGAIEQALVRLGVPFQTQFFSLHVVTDEHHVALLLSALNTLEGKAIQEAVDGIELGERAMAILLDEALGRFVDQPIVTVG